MWRAQRRFYARAGMDAWRTGTVPHHVTSNVAMATAYARIVHAFARDTSSPEPLDVVELGAGAGRFAFLFLRALDALEGGAAGLRVRYVMTDVADATIDTWRRHDALRPFVDAGRLAFTRFDAGRDERLDVKLARRTIAPDRPAARLVVIANYVLSGLPQDAFAIRGGRLREYLAATRLRAGGTAADVRFGWRVGRHVAAPYPERDLDEILRSFAEAGVSGHFLFPIGALRCLERLRALAPEALLVLAADRGTGAAREAVTSTPDLALGRHGAVSFPVSFHALGAWARRRGGHALCPSRRPRHVHVAGVLFDPGEGRRTRRAYEAALADGGPDAVYGARRRLASGGRSLAPRALLALMRRGGPDPRVVAECLRPLWPHLADAGPALRQAVRDAVVAAWPNYFHLGEAHDVPFALGLLLYEARAYGDARLLFEASLRHYGDDAGTWWNLGLCHVALGHARDAQRAFRRARALAPGLEPAGPVTVKTRRPPEP